MDQGRFARCQRPRDGRSDVFRPLDIFAVRTEAFGGLVQPDLTTPLCFRSRCFCAEIGLVGRDLKAPGMIDGDYADDCRFFRTAVSNSAM